VSDSPANYAGRVSGEVFWARRLRWRLRGALMWPAFAAATVGDGLVLHYLPPNTTGVRIVPGLIIASFSNLFLMAVIAPFFARRLSARERAAHRYEGRDPLPPEVLLDRSASILLVIAAIGLTVAGLGNRQVIVAPTNATEENAKTVRSYVNAHGTPEAKANIDDANTRVISKNYFRTCINLNDRSQAYCLLVNTDKNTVVKDRSTQPNPVPKSEDG
jgi:hypothetical protein